MKYLLFYLQIMLLHGSFAGPDTSDFLFHMHPDTLSTVPQCRVDSRPSSHQLHVSPRWRLHYRELFATDAFHPSDMCPNIVEDMFMVHFEEVMGIYVAAVES
ncbi:hypothetical protein CY34DRAFT_813297 [Suillus luteus UH-Slu-Lm8-n1]|uniref:Unplaced genomic scaffold CY34scaffold_717, whole genome shotgun sequence n=1 Tax=Suillus luteus UH-Slu-Lm8-n1 TaxID=930992 RepID=A0A0C9ZWV5_9AGAM|nr:hypothetical protein CY34DRAFT_813297 [Suillus luteus UH-Slu-Lm8-n1]